MSGRKRGRRKKDAAKRLIARECADGYHVMRADNGDDGNGDDGNGEYEAVDDGAT